MFVSEKNLCIPSCEKVELVIASKLRMLTHFSMKVIDHWFIMISTKHISQVSTEEGLDRADLGLQGDDVWVQGVQAGEGLHVQSEGLQRLRDERSLHVHPTLRQTPYVVFSLWDYFFTLQSGIKKWSPFHIPNVSIYVCFFEFFWQNPRSAWKVNGSSLWFCERGIPITKHVSTLKVTITEQKHQHPLNCRFLAMFFSGGREEERRRHEAAIQAADCVGETRDHGAHRRVLRPQVEAIFCTRVRTHFMNKKQPFGCWMESLVCSVLEETRG